jgi:hypothetical protein
MDVRVEPVGGEQVEDSEPGSLNASAANDRRDGTRRPSIEPVGGTGTYREVIRVEERIVDTLGRPPFPDGVLLVGRDDELSALVLDGNRIIRRIGAKESRGEYVGASNSGGVIAALVKESKDDGVTWRLSLWSRKRKTTNQGRSWELSLLGDFPSPSATIIHISDDGNTFLLVDNWYRPGEGHHPGVRTLDRSGEFVGELRAEENGGYDANRWYVTSDGAMLFVPRVCITPEGVRYKLTAFDRRLKKKWSVDLNDNTGLTFDVSETAKRLIVTGNQLNKCWLLDFEGNVLFTTETYENRPRIDRAGETFIVYGGPKLELHEVGKNRPLWKKGVPNSPQGDALRGYCAHSADISPDGRYVVATYSQWRGGGEGFLTAPRYVVVYDRAGRIVCNREFSGEGYTTLGPKVAFAEDGRTVIVQEDRSLGLLTFLADEPAPQPAQSTSFGVDEADAKTEGANP